jgi:hypothetical protein
MRTNVLFLSTLDDLEKSISSNDDYTLLCASKLIRQLFLDGANSLVDKVNKNYKLKLKLKLLMFQC